METIRRIVRASLVSLEFRKVTILRERCIFAEKLKHASCPGFFFFSSSFFFSSFSFFSSIWLSLIFLLFFFITIFLNFSSFLLYNFLQFFFFSFSLWFSSIFLLFLSIRCTLNPPNPVFLLSKSSFLTTSLCLRVTPSYFPVISPSLVFQSVDSEQISANILQPIYAFPVWTTYYLRPCLSNYFRKSYNSKIARYIFLHISYFHILTFYWIWKTLENRALKNSRTPCSANVVYNAWLERNMRRTINISKYCIVYLPRNCYFTILMGLLSGFLVGTRTHTLKQLRISRLLRISASCDLFSKVGNVGRKMKERRPAVYGR